MLHASLKIHLCKDLSAKKYRRTETNSENTRVCFDVKLNEKYVQMQRILVLNHTRR